MTNQNISFFKLCGRPGNRAVSLLLGILVFGLAACAGQAPEASKARSRAVINAGAIVPAEEVRVAEYLQYYEQDFPEPEQEAVALNLRLGNPLLPAQGGPVWLQIGLQARPKEYDLAAPLNLSLVIDRSGSMAEPDKMPYVKESLRIFLESLNPEDVVSIVAYSDHAEVVWPAQPVGDKYWIASAINRLQPGGSTNLHAGLMLGLQEVEKNFDIRRNNRVLLLTDGIANTGITDPARIAADALAYNQKGIYVSTIGLGLEFNDALLSQLARQGQGGYSFVDSAQEMDRIFREQVAGLKQRVAGEVSITITPQAGARLVNLTGLQGTLPKGRVTVPLNPMGTGQSQVLLAELQVEPGKIAAGMLPVATVQARYVDEFARRPVVLEQTVGVQLVPAMQNYDPLDDVTVLRNVTIQQTAEGLREIDHLYQQGQYEPAWRLAAMLEQKLNRVVSLTGDEQLLKDVSLMQRYQKTLAEALRQVEGRLPEWADAPAAGNGDYPPAPTVEIR